MMINKIFILSNAEIIRAGLASIIRKFFNIEISEIEELTSLPDKQDTALNETILFIDSKIANDENILKTKVSDPAKIIIILSNEKDKNSLSFKNYITINDTADDIKNSLSNIINKTNEPLLGKENLNISDRETDVLRLVALGYSNKEIAEKLFISIHTVISHRKNITEKLGIKSISGLTVFAILNKIIDTENIDPESLI